jgi:hypothetical protein
LIGSFPIRPRKSILRGAMSLVAVALDGNVLSFWATVVCHALGCLLEQCKYRYRSSKVMYTVSWKSANISLDSSPSTTTTTTRLLYLRQAFYASLAFSPPLHLTCIQLFPT